MCTCNNMAVTFLEQFLIVIQILLLLKVYIFLFYAHLYFCSQRKLVDGRMGRGLNWLPSNTKV